MKNNVFFLFSESNPYKHLLKSIQIESKEYKYYDITDFGKKYGKYL